MIRFTVVVANAGGELGISSSMMVTVVVDGLPTLTPSSSVLSASVTSSLMASSSWSPEMVKLAEFRLACDGQSVVCIEAGERRTLTGHGYCDRHIAVGSWGDRLPVVVAVSPSFTV